MTSLSPLQHTAIGAAAGLTEVMLMQPTVAIKNALQEGRALPRAPRELYRGLLVNAGAMLPITATQFGMNRLIEQTYVRVRGHAPDEVGTIGVAMGAGASSAFFGCPAEYVMIQQQRSGRPLAAELQHIISTRGVLGVYKGLGVTVIRESLYAAGYLGVLPILRRQADGIPALNNLPGGPMVASGLAAGLLAAVTTHPADTIKTRMQAFSDPVVYPQYANMVSASSHIVKTEGFSTLFAGLLPRAARITCAVFILTGCRNLAGMGH